MIRSVNRDISKSTPLIIAVRHSGSLVNVQTLVESGADMAAQDSNGFTPLMCAICSSEETANEMTNFFLQKAQEGKNIGINIANDNHLTALDLAKRKGLSRDLINRIENLSKRALPKAEVFSPAEVKVNGDGLSPSLEMTPSGEELPLAEAVVIAKTGGPS